MPVTDAVLHASGSGTNQRQAPGDAEPPGPSLVPVVVLVLTGWLLVWALARALDIDSTDPGWSTPVRVGSGVFAVAVTGWAGRLAVRRSRLASGVLVAATSVALSGTAAIGLHGTRWSFNALYSDVGFRTEAVTRFADSPALADYGYRGLPGYYPPALPWLQGRLADLLGQPAWTIMKPTMLVLAAGVPVVAYVLWRRVLPDLTAAVVVVATTVATADLVKPDEWLVLALAVPWWLELTRDIRSRGRRPLRWWVHGLVLGVLLLWHSYYFVPLAVATVLGKILDRLRHRPAPLPMRRALPVAAVGMLVAVPYWGPMAWLRLHGVRSDNLQLRWSDPGWAWPPWPLPVDVAGVLGVVGVSWLVRRARTNPLAEALAVGLVGTYAFFLGGELLQRWGVTLLPEKSDDLIRALLAITGALAVTEALSGSRLVPDARRRALVALGVAGVLAVVAAVGLADHTALGERASTAMHTRYPDGGYPAGGPGDPTTHRHPWAVAPGDPSVAQVARAWAGAAGHPLDAGTVLVSVRADLLATTPVHPFIAWKSIYSHPAGRFTERLALLHAVSRCPDAGCAARMLRDNEFDRVDGLVMSGADGRLNLPVTVDTFPDGWVKRPVTFRRALFRAPYFAVHRVGPVYVIALR